MKTRFMGLQSQRRFRTRKCLADQIRESAIPYQELSDQEAIDRFIKLEMMSHSLAIGFHEAAVVLEDETEANRPLMPQLLRQALQYESAAYSKLAYAELLYLTTLENDSLKKQLGIAEDETKQVKSNLNEKMTQLARLSYEHPIRHN